MSETAPTAQLEILIDAVLRAVRERLGDDADPQLLQLVVREVVGAMAGDGKPPGERGSGSTITDPLRPGGAPCARAIVTTSGHNTRGVVAAVATEVAHAGGDIQDLSQTIVSGFFTMIMIVDISELTISFAQFKEALKGATDRLGFHLVVVHEDVLRALQRV